MLFETYGYPALEEEIKMFMDYVDLNHDGKVTREELKQGINTMREELKKKDKEACEY